MQSFNGKVSALLSDPAQTALELVLDGGQANLVLSAANHSVVKAMVTVGSRIEVRGDLRTDTNGNEYLERALIINFDSKQSASLPAPVCIGKAGMPSGAISTAASLCPGTVADTKCRAGRDSDSGNEDSLGVHLEPLALSPGDSSSGPSTASPRGNKSDAVYGIERAYDRLHRIHAILAYLKLTKQPLPGIAQFLEEAQHTYEQALWRYEIHDFEGAQEYSAASRCLCSVVDIVASRTLRSDTSYPSLVPRPPEHTTACGDSSGVQHDLREAKSVLSRIHWLMENGTLPLKDRAQVRKITSWGDTFCEQSRRFYRSGSMEDACEFAQAARSAAYSAEHICRNWYVAQAANQRTIISNESRHT